jgi:hypothetical protein
VSNEAWNVYILSILRVSFLDCIMYIPELNYFFVFVCIVLCRAIVSLKSEGADSNRLSFYFYFCPLFWNPKFWVDKVLGWKRFDCILEIYFSVGGSGWAGCAAAYPLFCRSVTLLQPRGGAEYAHHSNSCTPMVQFASAICLKISMTFETIFGNGEDCGRSEKKRNQKHFGKWPRVT